MKIVFLGSAHFATPALDILIKAGHKILGVVTQPDKKKGRHLHLGVTDVKALALQAGLKVFQPEDINSSTSVELLKSLNPDLFIIVAYGQILSQEVLDIPKIFALNIHASLLPKYRGAAPINWAIIRGEKATGVTIMQVIRKMDAGAIIMQKGIAIDQEDDAVTLESKLRDLGAELLLQSIRATKNKDYKLTPQDEHDVSIAPKLKKSDGLIDWSMTALELGNLIRGALPWAGAFTQYKGKLVKIYKARAVAGLDAGSQFGKVVDISKKGIAVSTGGALLVILELQLEGKRRMTAEEFISRHKISLKDKFC